MSICKRLTRSLGTLIILWSAAACAAQSLEVTDVSGVSDAEAGSNEGTAVLTTETGPASQEAAPDPGVGTAPASESGAAVTISGPAKEASDGIEVHGHWVIEVRDPDGTLVDRREFDNALVAVGAGHLAEVLSRGRTVGNWRILLGVGANGICATGGITPAICEIIESTDGLINDNSFKTLTVSSSPAALLLTGTAIAQRTGEITRIQTTALFCANSVSPNACSSPTATGVSVTQFTSRTITAVPVTSGQQVQVSVTISFS